MARLATVWTETEEVPGRGSVVEQSGGSSARGGAAKEQPTLHIGKWRAGERESSTRPRWALHASGAQEELKWKREKRCRDTQRQTEATEAFMAPQRKRQGDLSEHARARGLVRELEKDMAM